ncbi:MAG: ATP synthase F0 subunit B [Alphaproteobacteria bacterium]|nr:ATP synthase F0 subunit B [Alphaproteobacteria bacterium]
MIPLFLGLTTAFATEPATHGAPASHGAPAATEHGEGGEHGGGHGGHHYYTDDDDHDGIANWMDPMNGSEPNTSTYVLKPLGFHIINFLLLIGVAVYFLRRPMADLFRDRALTIRTEITDSARQRDEAHQKHQELVARLAKIEGEITTMRTEADADAKREEEQLIERARREAQRIGEQAERNVRDEVARARTELRREAVELAVQLAESTLRGSVGSADQQSLARAFLASVGESDTTGRA